jgi:hypothetical protein
MPQNLNCKHSRCHQQHHNAIQRANKGVFTDFVAKSLRIRGRQLKDNVRQNDVRRLESNAFVIQEK